MNKKFTVEEAQELLRRYRLGHCTKEELEIVDRWYQSFDQQHNNEMDFAGTDELKALKMQMFENISDRIDRGDASRSTTQREKPVSRLYRVDFGVLARIAAILIVGTGMGFFFFVQSDLLDVGKQAVRRETDGNRNERQIARGHLKSTIYLSDGSVVWLKAGSRLEYPHTFAGHLREVTLTGEAFFDVARDVDRPFIIHSANFTTRVLGTSFNIKAYRNDDAAEVVVVTGEVLVSVKEPSVDKTRAVLLKPNQKAIYSKKDNSLMEAPATEEEAVKVTADKNKLDFDEIPLRDIIKVLNATYDANISLSNEGMEDCVITADLTRETRDVSMAILSRAIHASYEIDGKNIILRGNGCGVKP